MAARSPDHRFTHRAARPDDVPALKAVMQSAIDELQKGFLTPDAIVASREVMGLDSQLIADGTYFVIEENGVIAGCGGWSRRATLFGGDHSAGRDAALLDPAKDAARVRAMYTNPAFARRGVGRLILSLCEAAAVRDGFSRVELGATRAGEPLYRACGYEPIEAIAAPTSTGLTIPILRMGKALT
jgi:GNAT superfamily N-acetyltransferase